MHVGTTASRYLIHPRGVVDDCSKFAWSKGEEDGGGQKQEAGVVLKTGHGLEEAEGQHKHEERVAWEQQALPRIVSRTVD